MQCIAHPTRPACRTCEKCNHWLCDDCAVNFGGRLLCKSCVTATQHAQQTQHSQQAAYTQQTAHSQQTAYTQQTAPDPVPPHIKHYSVPHKRVCFSLLLVISVLFPPGANYMYMGLVKRGLATMCGFFLLVFAIVTLGNPLKLLAIFATAIYFITCFFDGFNLRRKINAGVIVEDGIVGILASVLCSKTLSAIFFVILALMIIGFLFKVFFHLLPVILVIFALYLLFGKKSPPQP